MSRGSGLYGALNRGPLKRSFSGKLLVLALLGAVPLMGALGFAASRETLSVEMLAGVAVLGLAASLLLWWLGFRSLLAPLRQTQQALQTYADKKQVPDLSTDGTDEVGLVMAQAQRSIVLLEQARRQRQADRTTDPITGLINQRSAVRRLGQDILRAGRDQRPLCLAMVNIDNNDQLAGEYRQSSLDQLSSRVSDAIVKALRRSDWVASHGKHDFLVGLWGVKPDAALTALERVAVSLRENPGQPVTLSIGITAVTPDQAPDTAIANAGNAMYKARSAGGNRIIVEI